MVKERTPLLLVFGGHPGRCGHLVLQGDREFFRSNLAPFAERWARAGRRAVMIHEYSVACEAGWSALTCHESKSAREIQGEPLADAQRRLDALRMSVNSALERTLGSGKGLTSGMEWFDWGCADDIIRINRARPGSIINVIEPLVAQAAVLLNRPRTEGKDALEAEKEDVERAVRICRIRSASLASYIKSLRESSPGMPIMVTRGFAHKGMEDFFDPGEFDITSASRLLGAPWPSTEAVIMGMNGTISDEDLTRFARLSMHFGEYYEDKMLGHMLDCIEGGVFDEGKFALLSHRAREYALRMAGT